MVGLFFLILSSTACKKDMDVTHHTQTDVSTYFSRESTLSKYDIEAWFESQYDTLKPRTAAMILHIMENADFGSMYADSLDEERNVVVVPMRPDYFSQHIPLESTPLQNLVLIEDGEIIQGNLFIYFPEDPQYEVIPMGGIRDFYFNANQFLDQSGKLKVVTLSDLKLSEFEYEAGVLHTSTVLSSEWDEEGSIENERRCQAWTLVRYYYDLVTGEILDYDILAEGNNCDNECPPGDIFCDEYFGWGGTGEPSSEDVTKVFTVSIFSDPSSFGLQAGVTLRGKKFDDRTLSYFTHQPNATLLTNGLVCMFTSPQYCDENDWRLIKPESIICNSRLTLDEKSSNAKISIIVSHPNNPSKPNQAYENAFTWKASQHLF